MSVRTLYYIACDGNCNLATNMHETHSEAWNEAKSDGWVSHYKNGVGKRHLCPKCWEKFKKQEGQ